MNSVVQQFYLQVELMAGVQNQLLPDSGIVNLGVGDPAHVEGYIWETPFVDRHAHVVQGIPVELIPAA